MNASQQVCTREQGERLKELGVTALSLFAYQREGGIVISHYAPEPFEWLSNPPAFTVAELGQMLNSEEYTIRRGSELSEYANWEWCNDDNEAAYGLFASEAEARADRLIVLLESSVVTIEQVNARISS